MKYLFICIILFSCRKVVKEDGCPIEQRIGCRCKDGTGFNFVNGISYSGECFNHGGVDYWHCN